MFGIAGSGFGLYGHLPAIAGMHAGPVLVPEKYKAVFAKREELQRFAPRIQWVKDEAELLAQADAMAISLWPPGQEALLGKCLQQANIRMLIAEKPLAATPAGSTQLLAQLLGSGKAFRINYSFLYTGWYAKMTNALKDAELISLKVDWRFLAHHYKHNADNWKRHKSSGGAAIRFYGIHILAVFSALGLATVVDSKTSGVSIEDVACWEAHFKNAGQGTAEILVDSASGTSCFKLALAYKDHAGAAQQLAIDLEEPFSEITAVDNDLDPRTEVLKKVHRSLSDRAADEALYSLYQHTNALWHSTEQLNIHTNIAGNDGR